MRVALLMALAVASLASANATDVVKKNKNPITLIIKNFLNLSTQALVRDSDAASLQLRARQLQSDAGVEEALLPPPSANVVEAEGELVAPLTTSECLLTFTALNFDTFNFDRYPDWFHDDSTLILSQAGKYKGAADIEEYVRFAYESSPYVLKSVTVGGKFMVHSVDVEARTCSYVVYGTSLYEMDSTTARKSKLLANSLTKLTYSYDEAYFLTSSLFLTPPFLNFWLGTLTNTDQTRNKICEVSEGCDGVNVGLTREECISKLEELPLFTNGEYFDGYDYGCRVLHASFAGTNKNHCPHISFDPLEDSKGKIKCNQSANIQVSDLFDDVTLKDFYDWLDTKDSVTQSIDGYKILYLPDETSTVFYVILGLVVPACIGLLTFGVLYFMQKAQSKDTEEDGRVSMMAGLMANKSRPLFVLILLMIATLALVFGIAGGINYAVAKNHPDWKYTELSNPMQDSYLAGGSSVVGTSPQTLLTDVEFLVYVGFVTWTTVVVAGLGLEIFVWHHFLEGNVWDDRSDGMWKFAQFLFPLLAMTTLGLAADHNYWALPILVPALWKFGFPETLMHLYLGIFNKRAPFTDRACELCNGFGTLLHHSAASFIISMLVVGVFPPSRYVLNPIAILVMQHWVALLKYVSVPLYSAIELILEYYFEWIILSDWAKIYNLHWTAAVGASVMLFAHWLYLSVSVFAMLTLNSEEEVEGETFGKAMATVARSKQKGGNVSEDEDEDEDMEEPNEEDAYSQASPRIGGTRLMKTRTTRFGFTTPMEDLHEQEALMGVGGKGRNRNTTHNTVLGRNSMAAQQLIFGLVTENQG